MLYIFDKDDILLEIIEDFEDDEMNRELNSDWTYNFKIDINISKNIRKPNKVGFFDDNKFYLFLIDEVNDTIFSEDIKSVYCINDIYSMNGHIIEDKRCVDYSIDKALEKALEGSNYVVGELDTFDINTVNFYYISSLTALKKIATAYNAEYMPRVEYNEETNKLEKYIDVKVKIGKDTGLRFTYDTNIEEIKRNEASDNHYTVLYGRGASLQMTDDEGQETGGYTRLIDFSDVEWSKENGNPCDKPLGQKYVEDVEAIEKYGRIEGIYKNKDIENTSELLRATYKTLQETKEINVSYEVSVEDLSNIEGFEHYKYTLGDRIIILDDDYDINLESRIIKETISLKNKTQVVTLGYIFPSMSSNNASNIVSGNEEKENDEDKFSDEDFPNTLPEAPVLSIDREGFASISLSWSFENKPYYVYELYASKLENFNPTENHLIWKGHGSAFLHEVNFNETWYYRARVINSHGQYTDFSDEVSATTYKIKDGTEVFEKAAIKEALIESLNADKINAGKVKGTYIDARNLNVEDGNGNVTFSVSSDAIVKIIQGLISISDEGIRINLIDSENKILGYVLYDGQGVQIFTQADESISHLTREGSYIDNLVVKHIKCSELFKVANLCGCSLNWYIADKATGDGTGRDEENKANSLKDVLRTIRNYGLKFTDVLNIYVESGILDEQIVIQDFEGTQINIIVSEGVIIDTDKFVIEDCGARLNIKAETSKKCTATDITADDINKRALIKTSNSDYAILASNSNYIKISGFRIRGAGGGSCVRTYEKGNVILEDCDISNFDYGMYANQFSMCCMNGCRGNIKQLAYTANLAPFSSTSNIPKCTEASTNDELVDVRQSGQWIKENSYTQNDTLYRETSTSTGDTPSTNITDNFIINNLYTKVEGSGKSNTNRNGYTGQGRFKTYQAHRGYMILPSAQIIASIQAKKNYEVKLSMTRLNTEHGYNSKTPHPVLRAVGSGIKTDYWDSQVKFARGETNVITLPDAIRNAIAEGATQLELWAETEQEKQYSFYNNISLIVEGENKESSGSSDSDFTYADELVETAMTYYRVCDNEYISGQSWSQGFTYRSSNTPMSGNCVAEQGVTNSLWVAKTDTKGNTRHYKAIDCSTGVNMWLRHIVYNKSPYKSEELFNAFRTNILQKNDDSKWAIVPTRADGKAARYAYEICNYFYRMNKGITYLKDPDTGKVIKGSIGTEADNYSKIKKGYIVFHAKKDATTGEWKRPKVTEFMHVSHVAICYGQSNTYNANSIIESTNVTTKKHTMTDGVTTLNAGMRIDKISKYADDIVMVVNPEAFLSSSSSGGSSGGGSTETTGKEEYTNCFNMSGTINGHNYIYKLQNCKITGYGGDSGSACNIPLSLAKTCGSFNLPYGTKVYIASMDGRTITDGNGKSVKSDGVFTINDTGVGCTDFDLYVSTKSDSDAEKVFKNTLREDVYILEYGSGYGYAWSYTQSYEWAYKNGTLSAYRSAFKDYIKYGGTLINFLKLKSNDANIRSSTYWSILNS
ncbi:phage tail spike protein [Intestinibacter bartlettii]|uniref:phage tail spike protein n=1 Tax=Intestinibacter bartlettii TaxID=261299 RepID=UPI000820D72C|nr:phage tail spike protein [Intestinibacter bartlettii]SCJ12169.1 phage minor structural protein%2C N-terminal region [uncultured Clostridium sp.]